jgi:hypothetical protein
MKLFSPSPHHLPRLLVICCGGLALGAVFLWILVLQFSAAPPSKTERLSLPELSRTQAFTLQDYKVSPSSSILLLPGYNFSVPLRGWMKILRKGPGKGWRGILGDSKVVLKLTREKGRYNSGKRYILTVATTVRHKMLSLYRDVAPRKVTFTLGKMRRARKMSRRCTRDACFYVGKVNVSDYINGDVAFLNVSYFTSHPSVRRGRATHTVTARVALHLRDFAQGEALNKNSAFVVYGIVKRITRTTTRSPNIATIILHKGALRLKKEPPLKVPVPFVWPLQSKAPVRLLISENSPLWQKQWQLQPYMFVEAAALAYSRGGHLFWRIVRLEEIK